MPKFYADDNRGHKVSLKNDVCDVNIFIDDELVAWIHEDGNLYICKNTREGLYKLGLVEDRDNPGYVNVRRR